MYAQLGDIVFDGLKGFSGWRKRETASLAQHDLIDGKPKLQRTGDGLDEITIDMLFHSRFCVPEDEMARLSEAKSNGEILPLISGNGETIGDFVIAAIDTSIKHTLPDGSIVLAEASVTLLESASDDLIGDAISEAIDNAFSNEGNNPNTVPFELEESDGVLASRELSRATSLQIAGTENLTLASNSELLSGGELRKAKTAFEGVTEAIESFEEIFSNIQSVISNADQITEAADLAKTYATNVVDAISDGNLAGAVSANRDLRNGISDLNSKSTSLITLTATRRI